MSFNYRRQGGAREGAGRPKIGKGRGVKITLPEKEWDRVESLIKEGHASSIGDYFRQLHEAQWEEGQKWLK